MNKEADDDYDSAFAEFSDDDSAEPLDTKQDDPATQEVMDEIDPIEVPDHIEDQESEVNTWDEAPEDLRNSYNDAVTRAESAEHKHRSDAGRVSALQRRINELEAAQPILPQEIAADNEPSPFNTDMDNDMPEIARDVRAIMEAEFNSRFEQAQQQISATVDERLRPIDAEYAEREMQSQFTALEAVHPDYVEVAKSQEYAEWFGVQSQAVQQLASSDYADDAASAISLFKSAASWGQQVQQAMPTQTSQRRQKQLAASQSIRSRASNAAAPIADDDYDAAFAFYADK